MSSPGFLNLLAAAMAAFGLVLLGLSVWELHKPNRLARATGLAWLLCAAGWGLMAAFLCGTAAMSHLPHVQRPFARVWSLGGAGGGLLLAGCAVLARVGAARERAAGSVAGESQAVESQAVESQAVESQAVEAQAEVWPPSRRCP